MSFYNITTPDDRTIFISNAVPVDKVRSFFGKLLAKLPEKEAKQYNPNPIVRACFPIKKRYERDYDLIVFKVVTFSDSDLVGHTQVEFEYRRRNFDDIKKRGLHKEDAIYMSDEEIHSNILAMRDECLQAIIGYMTAAGLDFSYEHEPTDPVPLWG